MGLERTVWEFGLFPKSKQPGVSSPCLWKEEWPGLAPHLLEPRVTTQQQGGIQPDKSHPVHWATFLCLFETGFSSLLFVPSQAFPIQGPHATPSSPSPQRTECSAALDSKAWCDTVPAENTRTSQSSLWKPQVSLHAFISLSGESYLWVDSFVGGKINKTNP